MGDWGRPSRCGDTPRLLARDRPHIVHLSANARLAPDIPGFSMSSSCCVVVLPGDGLVVGGVGFQAAVQDANESVGDLSQCCLVADPAFAKLLVIGACSG
jgi:hypothetical protein